MSDPLVINSGTTTDRADQAKKYKERHNALMQGFGSFTSTIGNIWKNAENGNIDLSGVSVWGNKDNGTCAFNS